MKPAADNRIEVRLRELAQLFNLMDPSPFIERDLDADAEEFIVGWAHELPHARELELVIHLTTPPAPDRAAGTEEAVRHYFASRADVKQRELRRLLRRGRANLLIGLLFLAACFALGGLVQRWLPAGWNEFTEMGLQIVGWVAMWRPLEIYLYDWWPLRSDERLLRRLARMKVSLTSPPA
ncbi:hypothetical protein Verru16b_00747 [Lacunisphaera limnophila]|uniref:Uncharacterized protein n=1 Tax=Lacunisphaera limnophila TaxID=1838286 RepID=A0A1D8AS18_9BACT|nr:hypothetical protein [Lacunisphaera limnophila]AOS43694.1 hypothetical protein Verru16b_00747 [Lacunisphaera limnophila]